MEQLKLFLDLENTSDENSTELTKCRHCGSDRGYWFSRTLPMGNFCENCGGSWAELDGVD